MVLGRGFAFFALIGFHVSPVFASECVELLRRLKTSSEMQPVKVGEVLFHNHELASLFQGGLTAESLDRATRRLIEERAFEIKIDENGFVVAADSRGSYSQAVWTRDLFRVARGLIAMNRFQDAKRVILAGLTAMSTPKQLGRFYQNLRDPSLHMTSPDSKQMVPHIRFDPRTLDEVMIPGPDGHFYPQGWNHKQNDALALMALVTAEALHLGVLEWKDLSDAHKAVLVADVAYFVRLRAWDMWDGGAWEEASALRTSSVALITSALEMFRDGRNSAKFNSKFQENINFPDDIKRIVEESLKPEALEEAVAGGYGTVERQLSLGEAPYFWDKADRQGQRFADAALAHLAWYPLKNLTEKAYSIILSHLKELERSSGTLRYKKDVYINAAYFFDPSDALPQEMQHPASRGRIYYGRDIHYASDGRDSEFIQHILGEDFEAQWSLADIIKVELLGQVLEKYPASSNREYYHRELERSALRMFGFVTGISKGGHGPYAIDAQRVAPWKWSEASIPVRDFSGENSAEAPIYYAFSRFTPLFWPTGEAAIAVQRLYRLLRNEGAPFSPTASGH